MKRKGKSMCSEGSRGDRWRTKGAWKPTDPIYKLKFFPESLFAPPQGPVFAAEMWRKTTKNLVQACKENHYLFSTCPLPPSAGSQLLGLSHTILPLYYKSIGNVRGFTRTRLLPPPRTGNMYKYMLKDKRFGESKS